MAQRFPQSLCSTQTTTTKASNSLLKIQINRTILKRTKKGQKESLWALNMKTSDTQTPWPKPTQFLSPLHNRRSSISSPREKRGALTILGSSMTPFWGPFLFTNTVRESISQIYLSKHCLRKVKTTFKSTESTIGPRGNTRLNLGAIGKLKYLLGQSTHKF